MKKISSKKMVVLLSVFLILVVVSLLILVGLPGFTSILEPLRAALHRRMAREPLQISQIVINYKNPEIVYASSHFYGMWKSTDGGKTWKLAINGLGTSDVYSMAIHPRKPEILFAATPGGGIYRSADSGSNWVEVSEGLTDTHMEDVVFDPIDPDIMYAATLREVFKSENGGLSWKPAFKKNRKVAPEFYVRNLLVLRSSPSAKSVFLMGTPNGGYRRIEGGSEWEPLREKVDGAKLTAFAYDPRIKTLYGGAISGKGIYKSTDEGNSWNLMETPPMRWVHRIVLNPRNPMNIFIGTRAKGVFRSSDGGRTWEEKNNGLTHNVIKGLAIDPTNPLKLYAGTPGMIATSKDGGESWRLVQMDPPSYHAVVSFLIPIQKASQNIPSPPLVWKEKCNECHGWTDPVLNYYPTSYWRISPTPRDWKETMDRMAGKGRNPMTPEEKASIYGYLNNFFGPRS
ncbi:MAG TPA: hypothetical protein VGB26_02970 [Nitrospiria bacterium]